MKSEFASHALARRPELAVPWGGASRRSRCGLICQQEAEERRFDRGWARIARMGCGRWEAAPEAGKKEMEDKGRRGKSDGRSLNDAINERDPRWHKPPASPIKEFFPSWHEP
jgi:hypothetical protein